MLFLSRGDGTAGGPRLGDTRARPCVEGPLIAGTTPPARGGSEFITAPNASELRASRRARTANRWSRLETRRSTESSISVFSSRSWLRDESREAMSK